MAGLEITTWRYDQEGSISQETQVVATDPLLVVVTAEGLVVMLEDAVMEAVDLGLVVAVDAPMVRFAQN